MTPVRLMVVARTGALRRPVLFTTDLYEAARCAEKHDGVVVVLPGRIQR